MTSLRIHGIDRVARVEQGKVLFWFTISNNPAERRGSPEIIHRFCKQVVKRYRSRLPTEPCDLWASEALTSFLMMKYRCA